MSKFGARSFGTRSHAAAMVLARADDGASLVCATPVRANDSAGLFWAMLDLALDDGLDLSGVDLGDIRDLHAALGRIIEDRAI